MQWPLFWEANKSMPALLVDLGGTHLRLGISHKVGPPQLMRRMRIRNYVNDVASPEIWPEIIGAIVDFDSSVRDRMPHSAPVVISFPGPVINGSRIVDAPTVAGASTTFPDLQSIVMQRTGREVHILNDI